MLNNKIIMSENEFKNIIDNIIKKAGINKTELAKQLGINPVYFSRLYNGHNPVNEKIINKIRRTYPEKEEVQVKTIRTELKEALYNITDSAKSIADSVQKALEILEKI